MSHSVYACPRCFSLKVRSTLGPGMYCDGCEKSEIEYGEARLAFTVQSLRQQITELQKKCRAADELAEFYGDIESWEATGWEAQDLIDDSDIEEMPAEDLPRGGKRARKFQKDYPNTEQ